MEPKDPEPEPEPEPVPEPEWGETPADASDDVVEEGGPRDGDVGEIGEPDADEGEGEPDA